MARHAFATSGTARPCSYTCCQNREAKCRSSWRTPSCPRPPWWKNGASNGEMPSAPWPRSWRTDQTVDYVVDGGRSGAQPASGYGQAVTTRGLCDACPCSCTTTGTPSARRTDEVACVIRKIDPFLSARRSSSMPRNWGRIIPRCGGHLVGYFLPHEGTNNVAWALIGFDSLASYEAFTGWPEGECRGGRTSRWRTPKRLTSREERTFVEAVDGTVGVPAAASAGGRRTRT